MAPIDGQKVCIYRGDQPYMDKLEEICNHPDTRDLPVFVLAVAGEFRTGKSFLLSYFLRYLANRTKNGNNWMGTSDEPLIGFDHRYDSAPVTHGINVWNQPFIMDMKDNKKMLVLVMDCQGIFCAEDEEEATRIFALATMVTSCMVFNLSNKLDQSRLSHLELFTAYANEATQGTGNSKPFQKAMLLIRDWQYPSKHSFGSEGGNAYYKSYTKGKKNSFNDTYREICCYLMPKPGDCVDDETYNGNLGDLKKVFTEQLKDLTESILKPEHVGSNLKEVTGQTITAGDFCRYFKVCCNALCGMNWKDPSNMIKMNSRFISDLAKKKALTEYHRNMEDKCGNFVDKITKKVITQEQLSGIASAAAILAVKEYEEGCNFTRKNDPSLYAEDKKALEQELNRAFDTKFKKQWEVSKAKEFAEQKAEEQRIAAAKAKEERKIAEQKTEEERVAAAKAREAEMCAMKEAGEAKIQAANERAAAQAAAKVAAQAAAQAAEQAAAQAAAAAKREKEMQAAIYEQKLAIERMNAEIEKAKYEAEVNAAKAKYAEEAARRAEEQARRQPPQEVVVKPPREVVVNPPPEVVKVPVPVPCVIQ